MRLNDPQLGPVLSGLIWLLLLCIVYLVLLLPFSANAGVIGGAITGLGMVLGLAIQARGKIADRRKDE